MTHYDDLLRENFERVITVSTRSYNYHGRLIRSDVNCDFPFIELELQLGNGTSSITRIPLGDQIDSITYSRLTPPRDSPKNTSENTPETPAQKRSLLERLLDLFPS